MRQLCRVEVDRTTFPVYSLAIGSQAQDVPVVGFFGGVHGLESIGTHVLLVFLRSLIGRLKWDSVLQHELQSVRLVFMPLVNPGGMYRHSRANPQGVDLMRNAPVDCAAGAPPLIGGQRIGPGYDAHHVERCLRELALLLEEAAAQGHTHHQALANTRLTRPMKKNSRWGASASLRSDQPVSASRGCGTGGACTARSEPATATASFPG